MNPDQAQRYARAAGILLAISLLAGGFGESFVPDSLLVPADFHATGLRLAASLPLFRAGFLAYLVEAACDLSLAAIFYLLLRPVSRPLALITTFFGIFGTATFAVGEIFYYAAALPTIDPHFAAALTPDARAAFAYICLKIFATIFNIFAAFYGAETLLRGYLVFRSGYLPRAIGALLMLAGTGFILKNLCVVLAPRYDSPLLIFPMLIAMLAMALWLSIKGIDRQRFAQRQAKN